MISLRFRQLAAVTGGELHGAEKADAAFTGVTIDSRIVNQGELFVAIRGDNNDGHRFIDQAIEKGASGVVMESSDPNADKYSQRVTVVRVADSHQAMLRLASKYRDSLQAKFVGITGSNGKTTTKELACQLIKAVEKNTYCSPGNLNNLYGVPLAIFGISENTKVAVLELGISTRDEMPRLANIVHPELILITNVGPSHLQFLDSVEYVARAKLELVRKAPPHVPVIVNADDDILVTETKKIRNDIITFSLENAAHFKVETIGRDADGAPLVTIEGNRFRLPLEGKHQVSNLMAAYAIFRTLGFSFEGVDTESLTLASAPMRGQRLVIDGVTFIADCYNANPDSMKAGLAAFFEMDTTGRRVVILGDMLELGDDSPGYHRQIGELLGGYDFELAILVGEQSGHIADGAKDAGIQPEKLRHFDDTGQAVEVVKELLQKDDFVYIKGSRGIGLEAVLNLFEQNEEKN